MTFEKNPAPTTGGVYAIIHNASRKRYIGSTTSFRRRWAEHKSALNRGIHRSPKLQAAWTKHGAVAFEFRVLEPVADRSAILAREQAWLDIAFPEYNWMRRAESPAGMKRGPLSAEHKAKLSTARKGKPLPPEQREALALLNRNRTPEHCANISKAKKGVPRAPEHIRAAALARVGLKRSEEAKKKTAEALRGKPKSPEHRAAISAAAKRRVRKP
jgi:group I intron endonuclease